jgi:hypothetical protein
MAASELVPGATRDPELSSALPAALAECRRVVAIAVHLPELLMDAAGLLQRLGAARVPVDVLVVAGSNAPADRAALAGMRELRVSELTRHRLALPTPFGFERADDILAALSELVGFDPEPGVFCLTPATDDREPCREAVRESVDRICSVYGLPQVRYSATPDAATLGIELDTDEWTRKYAGLAACATQVTPLSGRREHYQIRPGGPRAV